MTNDKFTIKIPRESGERHNKRRQELGVTWEDYIDGVAPQHDVPDADEIAAILTASMDVDGAQVDADELAAKVATVMDYGMLASKVAEELEGRFR